MYIHRRGNTISRTAVNEEDENKSLNMDSTINITKENTIIINNKYNKIIIKNKIVTIVKIKKYSKKHVVYIQVMSAVKYIQLMCDPSEKMTLLRRSQKYITRRNNKKDANEDEKNDDGVNNMINNDENKEDINDDNIQNEDDTVKNTKNENKKKIKKLKIPKKLYKKSHKKMNKKKKIENGNNNNKLKILQWNKANSNIINCLNEIKDIIKEKTPDIFVINEFNLDSETDIRAINISGYDIEIDDLIKRKLSRTGMYIKKI